MYFVITTANELRRVPKRQSVFVVQLGPVGEATLYGSQMVCRPGERTVRKFKPKATIDL
jgi:RNase P/RNase MRP subunit p29